jgi:hypothetical protein
MGVRHDRTEIAALLDLADEALAVPLPAGEGEEDLEDEGFQRHTAH